MKTANKGSKNQLAQGTNVQAEVTLGSIEFDYVIEQLIEGGEDNCKKQTEAGDLYSKWLGEQLGGTK